jgi:hypothetical protein
VGAPPAPDAWEAALALEDPEGVVHAIARARLLGAQHRAEEGLALLEPFAKALENDPAGGEMLRRVRWAERALR